jgi:hypothetical protein
MNLLELLARNVSGHKEACSGEIEKPESKRCVKCGIRGICFLVAAVGVAGPSHRLPNAVGLPDVETDFCWTKIASRGLLEEWFAQYVI